MNSIDEEKVKGKRPAVKNVKKRKERNEGEEKGVTRLWRET